MRTREIGFDAKRKADDSMPVAAGNEREGGAKRNNPTELTNKRRPPCAVFFCWFEVADENPRNRVRRQAKGR